MLESKFKTNLIKKINQRLPGSIVMHLDPTEIQGIPDLIVLYEDKWGCLEGKKDAKATKRPNQDYYVNKLNNMSFAAIVMPENEEEVLDDLQQALQARR